MQNRHVLAASCAQNLRLPIPPPKIDASHTNAPIIRQIAHRRRDAKNLQPPTAKVDAHASKATRPIHHTATTPPNATPHRQAHEASITHRHRLAATPLRSIEAAPARHNRAHHTHAPALLRTTTANRAKNPIPLDVCLTTSPNYRSKLHLSKPHARARQLNITDLSLFYTHHLSLFYTHHLSIHCRPFATHPLAQKNSFFPLTSTHKIPISAPVRWR